MNDTARLPNCGEFVRNVGTLVKVETIQPPPLESFKEYIFEEMTARCEIRFNGIQIKYLSTLNDYYGLGTCVESAIKDAKEYASAYKITPQSELEVVVVKIVSQFRAKLTNQENFYDKRFRDFQYLEYGRLRDLPEPIETLVWSSKK